MSCAHRDGAGVCIECEVPVFARNHYFTGKLLVERDFSDEQSYLVGKDRRHVQRLHGRGTVCGLKVVEHPQDACRDRWVIVEPGTAIDCCGREITVRDPDYFDFLSAVEAQWEHDHGPGEPMDSGLHPIQICIRYRECAGEDVPVLFDDGGCDEEHCQPNRILESFELGVRIDPPVTGTDPIGPRLEWESTINVARAGWVRRHDASSRVYVLAQPDGGPPAVYGYTTDHGVLVDSHQLAVAAGQLATDLALSPDGTQAWVALTASGGSGDGEVRLLDLSGGGYPQQSAIAVTGSGQVPVRLAVGPDGRLFVLDTASGVVAAYNAPMPPVPAAATFTAVPGAIAIDLSPDGNTIYLADGSTSIKSLDAGQPAGAATPIDLAGLAAHDVHVYRAAGHDHLVAAGTGGVKLLGLGATTTDEGQVTTAYDPVAVTSSPGGAWLYLLEQDDATKKGYVQPVGTAQAKSDPAHAARAPILIGDRPSAAALAGDGGLLYAAYGGDSATPTAGGVAVLEVEETACDQLWARALDPCPGCAGDDCIVLCTIAGYHHGDKVTQDGIDNLKDRPILASTELITEVVRCLLEGENATPPSPQPPPPPPAPPALVHVCGVSWKHDDFNLAQDLMVPVGDPAQGTAPGPGLLVMFDGPIELPGKLTRGLITMEVEAFPPAHPQIAGTYSWVSLMGSLDLVALNATTDPATGVATNLQVVAPASPSGPFNGLRWVRAKVPSSMWGEARALRVRVEGDFIIGTATNPDGSAAAPAPVDGNHLAPFLSGGRVSGDGTAGGLFESWLGLGKGPFPGGTA